MVLTSFELEKEKKQENNLVVMDNPQPITTLYEKQPALISIFVFSVHIFLFLDLCLQWIVVKDILLKNIYETKQIFWKEQKIDRTIRYYPLW